MTASGLAILGIGWLVFTQIRRRQRAKADREYMYTRFKSALKAGEHWRQSVNLADLPPPGTNAEARLEVYLDLIGLHLTYISAQLGLLLIIDTCDFRRRADDDTEFASLLANWEWRSPITRRE